MVESVNLVKKRKRSKFFGCFTTAVADDDPTPPSDQSRKKTPAQKRLSRSVKAVLCKISSAKKHRQDSCSSPKSEKLIDPTNRNPSHRSLLLLDEFSGNLSNPSSLFSATSTSSISSRLSNSTSGSVQIHGSACLDLRQTSTNHQDTATVYSNCNNSNIIPNPVEGLSIAMICLVALVFGGKAFAIVACTSACLLAGDLRLRRRRRPRGAERRTNNVVESKEYKKRVILEGLLERNRSH